MPFSPPGRDRVTAVLDADRSRVDGDEEREFVVNGEFVPRPSEAALSTYNHIYGERGRPVPPDRVLFRRSDGKVFALPARLRRFLDLFAEPTALGDARGQTWMLDPASADRVWDTLIRHRLIRRCPAGSPHRVPHPGRAAVAATL